MLSFSKSSRQGTVTLLALLFAMGLVVGGIGSYYVNSHTSTTLNNEISTLQDQVATLSASQNQTVNNQPITIIQNGTNLPDLYGNVTNSVVLVHGTTTDGEVQGSGFVYNYSGQMVIITNFHVIYSVTGLSVTFSDGNGYSAKVLGKDAYADLAVLSVSAPADEFQALNIVSSSSLRVGDQVIAIGNPYGLVGSLTTGIVSAERRTIQEDYTNFSLANIIQTSTPINPGNSGGPLLDAVGNVVGITTAIVSNSQGLGFAIPSNTIMREIASLVTTGSYQMHSYMGIHVTDMSYDVAQQQHSNVTYGVLIPTDNAQNIIDPDGPSNGKLQQGDIIVAMNGTKVTNNDAMASYLEGNTLPGDTVVITVIRNNASTDVSIVLGNRPTPNL
jgi:S1-C subfamily serine protease